MTALSLVERRSDAEDARSWRVFLTTKGRKSLALATETARQINSCLMEGFSDEEIDTVARWLASIQSKFPRGDAE